MNKSIKKALVIVIAVLMLLGTACGAKELPKEVSLISSPVKLPDPNIPGYSFPETEANILKQVNAGNQSWVTNHAWGLWTALTMEVLPGVRVYETWQSPSKGKILSPAPLSGVETAEGLHRVQEPHQFHGRTFAEIVTPGGLPSTTDQVLATVNWSPEMASDVAKNNYLASDKLNQLLQQGTTSIQLNNHSVSLKPTYLWLGQPLLIGNRYYQFSTWPGPPTPAVAFASDLWGQCIWLDTQDHTTGTGTGSVDTSCSADGSSRTPATTYGLGNFIQFRLSTQEAAEWQQEGINVEVNGQKYQPQMGDAVILVAMHVGTREMTEWTWQTFWWQPNPDQPPLPSSSAIATARPEQLKGAARHYALCTAYQMVTPNQPMTGGFSTQPVLCYNPYLEASFAHNPDLPDSQSWTYQGTTYNLNVGVQTNCMSCHIQAAYPQNKNAQGIAAPGYTADRYIDLNAPEFKGFLQMDFAWSIVQEAR